MAEETRKNKPTPAAPAPKAAIISWEGDSRDVLKTWPTHVRVDFGHSLREMQAGRSATLDVRPMTSIGSGVFELKTEDAKTWYRLIYLARIDDVMYVLDCFEKDKRKTEKKDIHTASARLALVKQRLMEERRNEKRKQCSEQTRSHH